MQLKPKACLALALLPSHHTNEPEFIAIPMGTTMGWVQSPATFCTMSEMVCNLANGRFKGQATSTQPPVGAPVLRSGRSLPLPAATQLGGRRPHGQPGLGLPFRRSATGTLQTWIPMNRHHHPTAPTKTHSVTPTCFVDDFIQIGQGGSQAHARTPQPPAGSRRQRSRPAQAGRQLERSYVPQETSEGQWHLINLQGRTGLDHQHGPTNYRAPAPPHRKLELAQIFTDLANTSRVSHKKFHRILGKLRFVSTATKGSAGLFSALQLALNCMPRTTESASLSCCMGTSMRSLPWPQACAADPPTRLRSHLELPAFVGTTDAAKAGMGGIYYDTRYDPHLWCLPIPTRSAIRTRVPLQSSRDHHQQRPGACRRDRSDRPSWPTITTCATAPSSPGLTTHPRSRT